MGAFEYPKTNSRNGNKEKEVYCHDLEVMSSNPGEIKLGVHSTSVWSRTWNKNKKNFNVYLYSSLSLVRYCWDEEKV